MMLHLFFHNHYFSYISIILDNSGIFFPQVNDDAHSSRKPDITYAQILKKGAISRVLIILLFFVLMYLYFSFNIKYWIILE